MYTKRNNRLPSKYFQLTAAFSSETLQARREHRDIVHFLKERKLSTQIRYPAALSIINKGEIKTSESKQKLKESVTTHSNLKTCTDVLYTETEKDSTVKEREGKKYHGKCAKEI